MALAMNKVTGITTEVPDHYMGHPVLGKNLIPVSDEAQAAPKKEKKQKEQPAPEVEVEVLPEPQFNIEENEE